MEYPIYPYLSIHLLFGLLFIVVIIVVVSIAIPSGLIHIVHQFHLLNSFLIELYPFYLQIINV